MKDLTEDLAKNTIKHLQKIKKANDLDEDNSIVLMMNMVSLLVVRIQHEDTTIEPLEALKLARMDLNEFLDNCFIREMNPNKKP